MVNVPILSAIIKKKPLVFNALKLSHYSTKALPHDITSDLGDNCIQNFHLRRYIVGYTAGNLVLRRWRAEL